MLKTLIKVGAAEIEAAARATQFAAMLLQFRRAIGAETRGYAAIRLAVRGFVGGGSGNDRIVCRLTHIEAACHFKSAKQLSRRRQI
jgi:hypothetical protein